MNEGFFWMPICRVICSSKNNWELILSLVILNAVVTTQTPSHGLIPLLIVSQTGHLSSNWAACGQDFYSQQHTNTLFKGVYGFSFVKQLYLENPLLHCIIYTQYIYCMYCTGFRKTNLYYATFSYLSVVYSTKCADLTVGIFHTLANTSRVRLQYKIINAQKTHLFFSFFFFLIYIICRLYFTSVLFTKYLVQTEVWTGIQTPHLDPVWGDKILAIPKM